MSQSLFFFINCDVSFSISETEREKCKETNKPVPVCVTHQDTLFSKLSFAHDMKAIIILACFFPYRAFSRTGYEINKRKQNMQIYQICGI